ncbi:MAG TPA: cupin domain-containing protein [Bryobacteraceae bacterium]|nr:cupin domain-containing protein [Bryobacteraceae bacterium]
MKALLLLFVMPLVASERTVDPTFLHRYLADVAEQKADMSTSTCHYRPLFGEGDSQSSVPRSVARFGEIRIDAGGNCEAASRVLEEEAYVVLEGSGTMEAAGRKFPLRAHDFFYVPQAMRAPGQPVVLHTPAISSSTGARLIVMAFRVPQEKVRFVPSQPQPTVANLDDVKWQTVSGHPDSVLYQLLIGGKNSKRDKIAAGEVLTSLFIMEFEPGGTNFPHHHDKAEEIYLVLDGEGDMVAGGGTDGVEGRHPARAGDAYFFRLNCTVGFYASRNPSPKARILAVRSLYPFSKEID